VHPTEASTPHHLNQSSKLQNPNHSSTPQNLNC
jgi:hypothetical protein